MSLSYSFLVKRIDDLNSVLFPELKACASNITEEEDCVLINIISSCGIFCVEAPFELFMDEGWDRKVSQFIIDNKVFRQWICDESLGAFTKSNLYFALCSQIVYPTQIALGMEFCSAKGEEGIDSNFNASFFITGIEHKEKSGTLSQLISLRGVVPAADEFWLWKDDFVDMPTDSIEASVDYLLPKLSLPNDVLKVIKGRDLWGKLFSPNTASELWLMYRALGNISSGHRLTVD